MLSRCKPVNGRHARTGLSREAACDNRRHGHSMRDITHLPALVAWLGFSLAVVFGAVANRVNFCTMGAVTDIVTVGDWRRMRMWLLAIAVAIAGVAALSAAGLVDFSKSIYVNPNV